MSSLLGLRSFGSFCCLCAYVSIACAAACGDDSSGGSPSNGGGPTGGAGGAGSAGGADPGGAPSTGGAGGEATGAGGEGGAEPEKLCEPGLPTVSFAADIQPILTTSCAKTNCHSGGNPDASLDLREGSAYAELVNTSSTQCFGDRTRITPGDPEESYLFDKIRNKDLCGNSKRMPYPPAGMLTADQRTLIEAWICAGALEN